MGERIVYFCDVCGKTIPTLREPSTTGEYYLCYSVDGHATEFEVCEECLQKIHVFINSLSVESILRGEET